MVDYDHTYVPASALHLLYRQPTHPGSKLFHFWVLNIGLSSSTYVNPERDTIPHAAFDPPLTFLVEWHLDSLDISVAPLGCLPFPRRTFLLDIPRPHTSADPQTWPFLTLVRLRPKSREPSFPDCSCYCTVTSQSTKPSQRFPISSKSFRKGSRKFRRLLVQSAPPLGGGVGISPRSETAPTLVQIFGFVPPIEEQKFVCGYYGACITSDNLV